MERSSGSGNTIVSQTSSSKTLRSLVEGYNEEARTLSQVCREIMTRASQQAYSFQSGKDCRHILAAETVSMSLAITPLSASIQSV